MKGGAKSINIIKKFFNLHLSERILWIILVVLTVGTVVSTIISIMR
ncbi:hypothetical protein DCCM_2726 [Desulfocucumis palustris]|uniref:Uncharacterized protein n=1 Tax=Desulfocucumis palustris TaxID=1898651 RepID=A0A2L2XBW4_9FIRM|nr:hypothetical protein DCCM_2726 [Desulfocucumis palustris]